MQVAESQILEYLLKDRRYHIKRGTVRTVILEVPAELVLQIPTAVFLWERSTSVAVTHFVVSDVPPTTWTERQAGPRFAESTRVASYGIRPRLPSRLVQSCALLSAGVPE